MSLPWQVVSATLACPWAKTWKPEPRCGCGTHCSSSPLTAQSHLCALEQSNHWYQVPYLSIKLKPIHSSKLLLVQKIHLTSSFAEHYKSHLRKLFSCSWNTNTDCNFPWTVLPIQVIFKASHFEDSRGSWFLFQGPRGQLPAPTAAKYGLLATVLVLVSTSSGLLGYYRHVLQRQEGKNHTHTKLKKKNVSVFL